MSEEQTQEATEAPEIEAKAKEMGWVPKDEFKGDPEKWRPAEDYVRRGERMLPIIRAEARKMAEKHAQEMADMRQSLLDMKSMLSKREQDGYQRAMRDLQDKERQAVETADVAAYEAVQREKADLQKELGAAGKDQPAPVSPDDDPAFRAWSAENPWYNEDVGLTAYAEQVATVVARRMKLAPDKLPPREFYDAITKAVKEQFPDKFGNARRAALPTVEGVRGGEGGGRKKGYADLPAEAKAACDRFVKQGVFKTRDEYVAEYFTE